jgi:hypothetical protein
MRLSDLLGSELRDAHGADLGRVLDVALVQEAAPGPRRAAKLRVDGLLVGKGRRGALAVRLGYHRHDGRGPLLLNGLARLLERSVRFVPWSAVTDEGHGILRLHAGEDQLTPVRGSRRAR